MQAAVRRRDETTCFTCSSVIKRDVGLCPQCGAAIAAGPAMTSLSHTQGVRPQAIRVADEPDVVGAGRYVLNFCLAGLIGLGLTYFLRKHGWLATWICIPILILAVMYYMR